MSWSVQLVTAWLVLVALSAVSAFLTTQTGALPGSLVGALLLLLAFAKARTILADYLHLRHSPRWLAGFSAILAFYVAALMLLHIAG